MHFCTLHVLYAPSYRTSILPKIVCIVFEFLQYAKHMLGEVSTK